MLDTLFTALSDKTRRDILELLRAGDLSVGEIVAHFPISQASISHHLDILKRAGLVVSERHGQFVHYSLNVSVFEECTAKILSFFHP